MKFSLLAIFIFLLFRLGNSQESIKKGTAYLYWGWNRSAYTHSDINFSGNDYNFTLQDVVARDRQSKFNFRTYFQPNKMTIPQYNFRIGYFFKDGLELSFGSDHMKYVMVNNQTSKISGEIKNSNTIYDGSYENEDFVISPDFLLFEHTDGLNYEQIELRKHHNLKAKEKIELNAFYGGGLGVLIPRTNTTLLNNSRYDEFHLSGFGLGVVGGLNITFYHYFFLQFESKFGYINMPDIRTTMNKSDRAKQDFSFVQVNGVFGVRYIFGKKKTP